MEKVAFYKNTMFTSKLYLTLKDETNKELSFVVLKLCYFLKIYQKYSAGEEWRRSVGLIVREKKKGG